MHRLAVPFSGGITDGTGISRWSAACHHDRGMGNAVTQISKRTGIPRQPPDRQMGELVGFMRFDIIIQALRYRASNDTGDMKRRKSIEAPRADERDHLLF
jgi:hypothetical protein